MDEDNRKPWKATYLRGEQDVQVIWADDEAEARWCATNLYLHEGDTLLSLEDARYIADVRERFKLGLID